MPLHRNSLFGQVILVAILVVASFIGSLNVWYLPRSAQLTELDIVNMGASTHHTLLSSVESSEGVRRRSFSLNSSQSSIPTTSPNNRIGTSSLQQPQPQGNVTMGYYHTIEEQNGRPHRFPSVEERLQVYMTSWYLPPSSNDTLGDDYIQYAYYNDTDSETIKMVLREVRTSNDNQRVRTFLIDATTTFDRLHFLRSKTAFRANCDNAYCEDVVRHLFPMIPDDPADVTGAPFLFQFSDHEKTISWCLATQKRCGSPNTPTLKKFRRAVSSTERGRLVSTTTTPTRSHASMTRTTATTTAAQPIIFKLKTQRHYGPIATVAALDRPYAEKRDQAVFRGQFTGQWRATDLHQDATSFADQCYYLPRCRLVVESANTSLIDAALALPVLESRRGFPTEIQGVPLYGERMSMAELLSYKAIIMLEGNDVSSGLKWALFSNSVVLMTPPTKTSWAMEELLEPWVHYVPLMDDLSDVESQMVWVLRHPVKAQEIARRGHLWISDLVFHPDADVDEQELFRRMAERYRRHFHFNEGLLMKEANNLRALSSAVAGSTS